MKSRWAIALTAIASLVLGTVFPVSSQGGYCVNHGNGTYTWQDPAGWSSTVDTRGSIDTWSVYDPNWGYYGEGINGEGQLEHTFIDADLGGDSCACEDGHTETASSYVWNGNMQNDCP